KPDDCCRDSRTRHRAVREAHHSIPGWSHPSRHRCRRTQGCPGSPGEPSSRRRRGGRMNLLAIIKVAARALGRNKLRTALTMLGIIIGVGAVIVLVSIGQGAQAMVLDQISSMGTNMMYIMPGNINFGGAALGAGAANTLTDDDVNAMEREVPTIAAA